MSSLSVALQGTESWEPCGPQPSTCSAPQSQAFLSEPSSHLSCSPTIPKLGPCSPKVLGRFSGFKVRSEVCRGLAFTRDHQCLQLAGSAASHCRLIAVSKWLSSACSVHSFHFIEMFYIFGQHRHLWSPPKQARSQVVHLLYISHPVLSVYSV